MRVDDAAPGGSDEGGVLALLDCADELVHESPFTAESLAVAAAEAADESGFGSLSARARYLRARVLAERGELEASMTLVGAARALWWEAGELLQALRTDLGRMHVLDDLGRHREALDVGEALLLQLDELSPPGAGLPSDGDAEGVAWVRAAALDNVGVALGFLGEHERALASHRRSQEAFEEQGLAETGLRAAANRGLALLALGRAHEALAVLGGAEQGFADAGDALWRATAQGHLAMAHRQMGDLVSALRFLERAREGLESLGVATEGARVRVITAGVYLEAGLVIEAQTQACAALETTTTTAMDHDTADARLILALAAASLGHHEPAVAGLQAAAELYEKVGAAADVAQVRLAESAVADAAGRPEHARRLAQQAADLAEAGGWLTPLALARLLLAGLAADVGDDASAAAHLGAVEDLVEHTCSPHARSWHRLQLARLRRRQGRSVEAEGLLREAAHEVEQRGGRLPGHELRTAFRAGRLDPHDELVDLLLERGGPGDVEAARDTSERARARTLVELVTGTVGVAPRYGPQDAGSREREALRSELTAVYSRLLTARLASERTQLRGRADTLERALTAAGLRSELAAAPGALPSPSLAIGDRWTAGSPVQEDHPRRRRGATVTYHLLGRDLVAFVTRDGHVEARRLAGVVPRLDAELAALSDQWSRFSLGPGFVRRHEGALLDTTLDVLGAIDRLVMRPLEPLLAGTEGSDLLVVPHGRLQQIPFHALHDGREHRLEQWLLSEGPTASGGQVPRSRPLDPAQTALVLAVADESLPAVGREAAALAELLPAASVLLGADATRAALAARVPGPGLLHIACHGLHRAQNPLFSALRLGDGWLTAADVLSLELGGALVTLSACESGRAGSDGSEPVGLAWAFLAAGASGVVVSQWLVHDEVTAELMTHYTRLVVAGHPPASALRSAQLTAAAEHPHPYFWAPFTFVAGPGSPARGGPPPPAPAAAVSLS